MQIWLYKFFFTARNHRDNSLHPTASTSLSTATSIRVYAALGLRPETFADRNGHPSHLAFQSPTRDYNVSPTSRPVTGATSTLHVAPVSESLDGSHCRPRGQMVRLGPGLKARRVVKEPDAVLRQKRKLGGVTKATDKTEPNCLTAQNKEPLPPQTKKAPTERESCEHQPRVNTSEIALEDILDVDKEFALSPATSLDVVNASEGKCIAESHAASLDGVNASEGKCIAESHAASLDGVNASVGKCIAESHAASLDGVNASLGKCIAESLLSNVSKIPADMDEGRPKSKPGDSVKKVVVKALTKSTDKSQKKKPKKSKKCKSKFAKVVPINVPDSINKDTSPLEYRQKIYDMFCVEKQKPTSNMSPGEERLEVVSCDDDSDDDRFNPGVWGCEFVHETLHDAWVQDTVTIPTNEAVGLVEEIEEADSTSEISVPSMERDSIKPEKNSRRKGLRFIDLFCGLFKRK